MSNPDFWRYAARPGAVMECAGDRWQRERAGPVEEYLTV